MKPWVQSKVISYEIYGGIDDIRVALYPSLFDFILLIFIPPFLCAHLSLSAEVLSSVDQAAHYYITYLLCWGLLELGWSLNTENFFC
jgi:hypothetical protein